MKLSTPEMNHILDLIRMNQDDGTYMGPPWQWARRNRVIKTKLENEITKR